MLLGCITPSAASLPPTEFVATPTVQPPLPTAALLDSAVTPTSSPSIQIARVPTEISTPTYTPESDRVWSEGPLGADTLTIQFYSNSTSARCLSLKIKTDSKREIASVSGCSSSSTGTVYALRANVTDSKGAPYTIVVGRAFDSRIVVMSVEFYGGDNSPAPINDEGFMDVSPGKRTVIAVVPIDQYGNLVGSRFVFGR